MMMFSRFYLLGIVLVVASFAVAWLFVAPAPPRAITIATGSENGGYHRFGIQLKAALEKKGLKVTLRPSNGTIENLQLLADRASGVSVAFGQGGVERYYEGDKSAVCGLGSLFYEPLWIFYRREAKVQTFADMKRLKVAIGKDGSGTQMTSMALLSASGFSKDNWFRKGSIDAVKAIQGNEVQAIFLVAPVNDPMDRGKPHPDVYALISDPNLALYSVTRAAAFVSRLPDLSVVTIGEGLVDLEKNYPPEPVTLLSPTATLLCREDFDGALAVLILQTCREIQKPGGWLEKPGQFPSEKGVTFPLLPEARQFYEKGPSFLYQVLPFWIANVANRFWIMAIPLLTLVFPLFKLVLPTYNWRLRYRIARKYRLLMSIDDKIADGTIAKTLDADIDALHRYEDELAKMSVPIMLADDYYTLRVHVRYLRTRLKEIQAGQAQQPAEGAAPAARAVRELEH
jgi:uncharacterized protein